MRLPFFSKHTKKNCPRWNSAKVNQRSGDAAGQQAPEQDDPLQFGNRPSSFFGGAGPHDKRWTRQAQNQYGKDKGCDSSDQRMRFEFSTGTEQFHGQRLLGRRWNGGNTIEPIGHEIKLVFLKTQDFNLGVDFQISGVRKKVREQK